jgi:hypothetical protein
VDELLAGEPAPGTSGPPGPRLSLHSLTGEIPIEFDEVTDVTDDFEDEAETIPPPRRASLAPAPLAAVGTENEEEQDVSGDDLFSAPPPAHSGDDGEFQEIDEVSDESFVGAVAEPESMEVLGASEYDGEPPVNSDDLLGDSEYPAAAEGQAHEISQSDLESEVDNEALASGVSHGVPAGSAEEPTTPWSSRPPVPEEPVSGVSVPPASRVPDFETDTVDHGEPPPPVHAAAEQATDPDANYEGGIAFDDDDEETRENEILAPAAPEAEPTIPEPERAQTSSVSSPAVAPSVDDILLEGVRGFEDLPDDMQRLIVGTAVLTTLSADEEVGSFGAALVTRGRVGIMPAVADVASAVASPGEIVFTQGTIEEKIPLRVVALEDGTVVASWTPAVLEAAFADCPWVADELRQVANRFQALAGATLGALGERLDDTMREMVFSRLEVKAYSPGETIVTSGKIVPGMHIVGSGRVELDGGGSASPGEFLFAAEVLGGGKAKESAKAGKTDALILVASRGVAHEMLVSVPPLLEILAG